MGVDSLLRHVVRGAAGYVELRWQRRTGSAFEVTGGRVRLADRSLVEGVAVRTLVDGAWGCAATAEISERGIGRALAQARRAAAAVAVGVRARRVAGLAPAALSTLDFTGPGFLALEAMGVADKLGRLVDIERRLAAASKRLLSAEVRYTEYLEEKAIVTSDGADCRLRLAQPELVLSAIAEKGGERAGIERGAGVSGGWDALFGHPALADAIEQVAATSVDLLGAGYPRAGPSRVILAPALVGMLCHEAIGHTVEADLVQSGSVAAGKVGMQVASPLVTLSDGAGGAASAGAAGNIPFDDEGVAARDTVIIRAGRLENYLHDRESAARFGAVPGGNARAWSYLDEPLIRMRNTWIAPGQARLADMVADMDEGYLLEGLRNGQADTNGEFMFGCTHVWEIRKGKKAKLLQGTTVSGMAFDVLRSVDAVSDDFRWDMGIGHCGKGQHAKVDAGGPYIRCELQVGGRS